MNNGFSSHAVSIRRDHDAGWLARLLKDINRTRYLQFMMIPGLLFYIIFRYIPMYGVIIAFKNFNMSMGIMGSPWIGLDNFITFIEYPYFWRLVKNTFIINVYHLIFVFPAPIILALMLNEIGNQAYKKLVQTVSYLPHFISMVAVAGILYVFLSPQGGFVNNFLALFGIEPIYFLAEPKWYRTIFIASDIWKGTGFSAIIYLAALSNINPEMYEAATIDGATRLQKIMKISLPSIMPTIVILLILNIGSMMSLGTDKSLLLQSPVTYEVSDVISTFTYRRGLVEAQYGFGTAVGLMNALVNVVLLTAANALSKRVSDTSLW